MPLPAAVTLDEQNAACFIVRDNNGQTLCYFRSSAIFQRSM